MPKRYCCVVSQYTVPSTGSYCLHFHSNSNKAHIKLLGGEISVIRAVGSQNETSIRVRQYLQNAMTGTPVGSLTFKQVEAGDTALPTAPYVIEPSFLGTDHSALAQVFAVAAINIRSPYDLQQSLRRRITTNTGALYGQGLEFPDLVSGDLFNLTVYLSWLGG